MTIAIVNTEKTKNIKFENTNPKEEKEIIGVCPRCKKNIYENNKSFYCVGYKDNPKCNFSLWKNNKFYGKITKTQAKKMLKGESVLFKKLKNKKGETYEAYLKIEDTGKYVNLKIDKYNN